MNVSNKRAKRPYWCSVLFKGWTPEEMWFLFLAGTRDFSLLHNIQTCSETHSTLCSVGTKSYFCGDNADHYIHLVWRLIYGAIPPISICLHGLQRGNFTFYLYLLYLLHTFQYSEVVCEVTVLDVCTLCTCDSVMLIAYKKYKFVFNS